MIDLLNINCMDYMKSQPDKSFDICITSPPYNMNLRINAKGNGYCSRQIKKEISTKYVNYSDNLPMDKYEEFIYNFLVEAIRISDIVFFNIQQITGNKPAVNKVLGRLADHLKETIIWDKCVYQPAIREKTLNSSFEFIYVFGLNPIARQFKTAKFKRGAESNIWKIPSEARKNKQHGAGFPLLLPEKICIIGLGTASSSH